MTGAHGEMPFLDHLEELRSRILRSLGALVVGFGIGLWLVQQFQLVNLLKRPIAPYLTGRQAGRHQPHRAGDDRLQARLPGRPGARLARSSSGSSGPSWRRRSTRGRSGAGARAVRRPLLFLTGAVAGLRLRGAAGAPGAVQLPDRSHPAVHHLRRVFRFRAPGRARARALVRAASRHHHSLLAGRDQPGGAGTGFDATRWSGRSSPARCSRRAPTWSR